MMSWNLKISKRKSLKNAVVSLGIINSIIVIETSGKTFDYFYLES